MIPADISAFLHLIWKRNRSLFIFAFIFIAAIQVLLIYFNSTLDFVPMVEMFLSQLPMEFKQSFLDDIMAQISLEGTIAFGLEHPIVITLFTFLSINIISTNAASNSGDSQMEIILSHPFRRESLISSLYFFTLVLLFFLILSAFSSAVVSSYLFYEPDPEILRKTVLANLNAFALHAFIMSYTLFFSVYFKDVTKAVRVSAIIALLMYFIDIISEFWDFLHFTKYVNFFSYFEPPRIMTNYSNTGQDILVLIFGSILLFILSYRKFRNKDIF